MWGGYVKASLSLRTASLPSFHLFVQSPTPLRGVLCVSLVLSNLTHLYITWRVLSRFSIDELGSLRTLSN